MKKMHIVALVMIAAAAVMIVLSSADLSTFTTFAKAEESGKRVKVSGTYSKLDPMVYEPTDNPNYFSFYLIDQDNKKRKVEVHQPKEQGFEMSESIVVTGKMDEEGVFQASELLLKCPSKYKEEQLALRKEAAVDS